MKNIKVLKRDGTTEDFDFQKIERVVKATGLNEEQTREITKTLEKWIEKQEKEIISSKEIRDEVLINLKKYSSYAAGLYEWYQKTKEGKA